MKIASIKNIIWIIIDSLFPLTKDDLKLFSYTKEQAYDCLPKSSKTPISNTDSVFSYKNKIVTRLIWNIKYKKNKQAIEIGAYALCQKINNYKFPEIYNKIILIPIPISQKRKDERGFNQCELLITEMLKIDKSNGFIILNKFLIRNIHKDRQTLKNREERLKDTKDIFSLDNKILEIFINNHKDLDLDKDIRYSDQKNSIKDIPIIIIDDVITTGSTIKEAMGIIRKAGFKKVYGFSLAH